jgi:p24 family protein delta-1
MRRHDRHPLSLLLPLLLLLTLTLFIPPASAIKFTLQSYRFPPQKCIWNAAHDNALVIVTAIVGPGEDQRVDIEIVDSSPQKNVYLSKRNIQGETRLAVTTHAEGEVGVCLKNYLAHGTWAPAPVLMRWGCVRILTVYFFCACVW